MAGLITAAVVVGIIAGYYSQNILDRLFRLLWPWPINLPVVNGSEFPAATTVSHVSGRRWSCRRGELVRRLCLAAIFEPSAGSRMLIYEALAENRRSQKNTDGFDAVVDSVSAQVIRNWGYADLEQARLRLDSLRAALGMDGDKRTRVDRGDLTISVKGDARSRCLCSHELHRWTHLREPLKALGSLVLICATLPSPWAAAVCLDYHRVARIRQGLEQHAPTRTGALVIQAKYAAEADGSEAHTLEALARSLAILILRHRFLADVTLVSAVPGTDHSFSLELGRRVARLTSKEFVELQKVTEPELSHAPTGRNCSGHLSSV